MKKLIIYIQLRRQFSMIPDSMLNKEMVIRILNNKIEKELNKIDKYN
jgi:hypothetical protein